MGREGRRSRIPGTLSKKTNSTSSSISGFSREHHWGYEQFTRLNPPVKQYLVSGDPSAARAVTSSVRWLRDVRFPTQKLGLLSQSNSAHARERKDE